MPDLINDYEPVSIREEFGFYISYIWKVFCEIKKNLRFWRSSV